MQRKLTWRAMRRRSRRTMKRAIARGKAQQHVGTEREHASATAQVCHNLRIYGPAERRWIMWDDAEHIVTRREAIGYHVHFTMPQRPRARIVRKWTSRVQFYIDARGFKRTRRMQDAKRKHAGALAQALATMGRAAP